MRCSVHAGRSSVASLVHERDTRFGGAIHNSQMERMNGELRDRERIMRGLEERHPNPFRLSNFRSHMELNKHHPKLLGSKLRKEISG